MPKGIPPKEHQFKKGEVRNPLGAGAHNKELKAIKKLTQKELAEVATLILRNNVEELKAVGTDPDSSVLKVWICSVAAAAIKRGDALALNVLLDRIVGKVKDVVETTSTHTVTATDKQVEAATTRFLEKL